MSADSGPYDKFTAETAAYKAAYSNALLAWKRLCRGNPTPEAQDECLAALKQAALARWNYYEQFAAKTDVHGGQQHESWIKGFAEECAGVLTAISLYYRMIRIVSGDLGRKYSVPRGPTYASMQRLVAGYCTPKVIAECKKALKDEGLPVEGFKDPAKPPFKPAVMTMNSPEKPKKEDDPTIAGAELDLTASGAKTRASKESRKRRGTERHREESTTIFGIPFRGTRKKTFVGEVEDEGETKENSSRNWTVSFVVLAVLGAVAVLTVVSHFMGTGNGNGSPAPKSATRSINK